MVDVDVSLPVLQRKGEGGEGGGGGGGRRDTGGGGAFAVGVCFIACVVEGAVRMGVAIIFVVYLGRLWEFYFPQIIVLGEVWR